MCDDDTIPTDEWDAAFPPLIGDAEVRAYLRDLAREYRACTFPGATAAEAGRAAERVGRVDPFN